MPSACNRKRGMRAWVPSGDTSERKLPVPVVEIIGFLLPYPVNQSTRRRIAGCRGFGQNLFHPCIRRELFALLDADRGPEAERGQAPKRAAIILYYRPRREPMRLVEARRPGAARSLPASLPQRHTCRSLCAPSTCKYCRIIQTPVLMLWFAVARHPTAEWSEGGRVPCSCRRVSTTRPNATWSSSGDRIAGTIRTICVNVQRWRRSLHDLLRDHHFLDAFKARQFEHGIEQDDL